MTDARLTQESLELWTQTTADARATSVVAEEWGTVTSINRMALVTSMAIEMWANVPSLARPMQTGVAINTG